MGLFSVSEEEIKDCIDDLRRFEPGESAGDVVDRLRPTLEQVSDGVVLLSGIQKLLLLGRVDEAVALLEGASRRRPFSKWPKILKVIAYAIALVPTFVLFAMLPRRDEGHHRAIPVQEALSGAVELHGKVTAARGKPVKAGDGCTVTVSPTPNELRARSLNCHVKVQCGASVLYGWTGMGATHCKVSAGSATHADDIEGAALGDDPMLALDVPARTCRVSDDGDNPFEVQIALE